MCLVPPSIQRLLNDPADRRHLLALGPVRDGASVLLPLTDLAAQATLHGQNDLALALSLALGKLEAISAVRVAA